MSDLFSISGWDQNHVYSEFDAVKISLTGLNYYYYSLIDNNIGRNPTGTSTFWTMFPLLAWQPSYTTNASIDLQNNSVKFGDGYEQRITNYLDSRKLEFNIVYQNINKRQLKALCNALIVAGGHDVLGFNPSGVFNTGNGFICNNINIEFVNYDNYNLNFNAKKVYELGNYIGNVTIDINGNQEYWYNGLFIEAGVYKIKYDKGVICHRDVVPQRWQASINYNIFYGSLDFDWLVSGNGTGVDNSWTTEELGAQYAKILKPEINFYHTGGKISINFDDILYSDNASGTIPLQFALYKIK